MTQIFDKFYIYSKLFFLHLVSNQFRACSISLPSYFSSIRAKWPVFHFLTGTACVLRVRLCVFLLFFLAVGTKAVAFRRPEWKSQWWRLLSARCSPALIWAVWWSKPQHKKKTASGYLTTTRCTDNNNNNANRIYLVLQIYIYNKLTWAFGTNQACWCARWTIFKKI